MVDVAQLVRVSVCGTEGRRFEPGLPPKKQSLVNFDKAFLFLILSLRKKLAKIKAFVKYKGLYSYSKKNVYSVGLSTISLFALLAISHAV